MEYLFSPPALDLFYVKALIQSGPFCKWDLITKELNWTCSFPLYIIFIFTKISVKRGLVILDKTAGSQLKTLPPSLIFYLDKIIVNIRKCQCLLYASKRHINVLIKAGLGSCRKEDQYYFKIYQQTKFKIKMNRN